MFRNHLKIAIRNLRRNTQFSAINVAGLALGMSVFLLILQYVSFEWSANRFNKNYDNLYRADVVDKDGQADFYIPPGFAPMIKNRFPGIKNYASIAEGIGSGIVSVQQQNKADKKLFREESIDYADADMLNVFSFVILDGKASLKEPATVALSETYAQKFFGRRDVVGELLTINNQFGALPYTVTAVFKDAPAESDIKAGILVSLATLENEANRNGNDWADPKTIGSGFTNIYFVLDNNVNVQLLQKQITDFCHNIKPETKTDNLVLQPFSELHLAPSFNYSLPTYGSLPLVALLLCVGILILCIAWVNYINLSTAQALNRAKEVGVRKVLGASRGQLIFQYLMETCLLTISAVVISIALAQILQPFFNSFTGKDLSLSVLNKSYFWLGGISLIVVASLLSGCYVAFVLSAFNPAKVISGKISSVAKGFSLRKSLVVFQFTISVVFIIATIVLYKQLQFMQTQNLGMNIQQRLVIKGPTGYNKEDKKNTIAFKNILAQLPFIEKFSASNNIPGQGYNFSTNGITRQNPRPGDNEKNYSMLIADDKFFDVYDIKFAEGKNFTSEDAIKSWSKSRRVIINEKAAEQLGFGRNENVAGKKILWGSEYEVIGVIKDYHHFSLRQPIEPAIILPAVSQGYFTILTNGTDMPSKLAQLKTLYQSYFSGYPFEYFFADEQYDKQYNSEQKLGNVFIAAAFVAIFIGCMGLFGLAAFSARQRVKEIGIRKVLGATVTDITGLLSKDFIKLVLVSIIIASPVAWWAMNSWLQNFAFRTELPWWIFVLAGFIAIAIALFTISFQSVKAALTNPVKNLRTE